MTSYITIHHMLRTPLLLSIALAFSACDAAQDSNDSADLADVSNTDIRPGPDTTDIREPAPDDIVEVIEPGSDTEGDIEAPLDANLWPDFENKCAKSYPQLRLPALTGEFLDAPDQIEVSLKWETAPSCPEGPAYLATHPYFGQLTLDESQDEPTIIAEHGYDWGLGYGIGALTKISADSGTILECDPIHILNNGFTTAWPPLLHPGLDNAPLIAANVQSWRDDPQPPESLWWYSPGWETPLNSLFPSPNPKSSLNAKLLPDGQLILFGHNGYLFSIDSFTGELNWILKHPDIRTYTTFHPQTVAWRPEQNDFVVESRNPPAEHSGPFVAIDHCGEISEVSKRDFELAHRTEFGDGYLFPNLKTVTASNLEPGIHFETAEGELLEEYRDCTNPVSLAPDAIACGHSMSDGDVLKISIIKWEDAHVTEDSFIIENTHETEHIKFGGELMAFRDSVLMTIQRVDQLDEDGNLTGAKSSRLFFINWKTGEVIKTFDSPKSLLLWPLVTEDGTLISSDSRWDGEENTIFALETNLHGLTPTAFPRGWIRGRNRDMGAKFPRQQSPP